MYVCLCAFVVCMQRIVLAMLTSLLMTGVVAVFVVVVAMWIAHTVSVALSMYRSVMAQVDNVFVWPPLSAEGRTSTNQVFPIARRCFKLLSVMLSAMLSACYPLLECNVLYQLYA